MPTTLKSRQQSNTGPHRPTPISPDHTISEALAAALAIAVRNCRAEGFASSVWRDVQQLANEEAISRPIYAKLAIDHASEKVQRALRVNLATRTVMILREKAASNRRISAEDLDDALFSMIITMNYLSTMGEDGVGHVELLARGDTAKAGSSKGDASTPSDEWKVPAKAIFETLWANGERHKLRKAWAARLWNEAERLQKGSTSSWAPSGLPRAVSGWLNEKEKLGRRGGGDGEGGQSGDREEGCDTRELFCPLDDAEESHGGGRGD